MSQVTAQNIQAARERIARIVIPSPLKRSVYLSNRVNGNIFLKLENLNISGSFKIRGAANALLQIPPSDLARGVIAASAGNHAQGVAYVCRQLGVKATIFMPERTPLVKADATRNLGGHVQLVGDTYDDAYQASMAYMQKEGGIFIHPFADERVICGQGTIGLELLEQLPDLDAVLIPIGGGGLISGIATALKSQKPQIKIFGVQTSAYPAVFESVRQKKLVLCKPAATIADGIAVKGTSDLNLSIISKLVDEIILVEEEAIAAAITDVMERDHLVAEGAGAVTIAALLSNASILAKDGMTVAAIVSGGNIDVNLLGRITSHGLIHSGRLMHLQIRIKDRPGKLAELLNAISNTGANLLEVRHNRLFGTWHFDEVEVEIDLETTSHKHQATIEKNLQAKSYDVRILRSRHG